MADTHGYETINDRAGTSGGTWGHTDGDAPTADAPAESLETRLTRTVDWNGGRHSDGAGFDANGNEINDEYVWGTNTAKTTAHTEVASANREAYGPDLELDPQLGSINDRRAGWGNGGLTPDYDLDGDGVSNDVDPDIDGDGVPNEEDFDPWDPDVQVDPEAP